MRDALSVIRAALASDEYSCPGWHRVDGQRGDYEDLIDELMTKYGVPDDWDEGRLQRENAQLWKRFQRQANAAWIGKGDCKKTITIDLEYDGDEYQTFAYPVASGECATALGLDEMAFDEHAIFQVWAERQSLRRTLSDAERSAQRDYLLILETAS